MNNFRQRGFCWMVLVHIMTLTEAFCPQNCTCTKTERASVDCTGADLEAIPILLNPRIKSLILRNNRIASVSLDELGIYGDLEFLDLSANQILHLDKGSFFRLRKLKVLRLNENLLNVLEIETFAGLNELRFLDLSQNRLFRLATSVFADLRKLEVLKIAKNSVKSIAPGAFTGLITLQKLELNDNELEHLPKTTLTTPKRLKFLDLSRNKLSYVGNFSFIVLNHLEVLNLAENYLNSVHDQGFVGLYRLRDLDLRANNFYRIPTISFRSLTDLKILDVGHNLFQTIPTSSFEGLGRLERLTIDQCPYLRRIELNAFSGLTALRSLAVIRNSQLSFIDPMAFERPNKVQKLLLSDNALTSLPKSLLDWRQVKVLDLQSNPWHCDCDLSWMDQYSFSEAVGSTKCATPFERSEKNFHFLSQENKSCGVRNVIPDLFIVAGCLALLTVVLVILFCVRSQINSVYVKYNGQRTSTPKTATVFSTESIYASSISSGSTYTTFNSFLSSLTFPEYGSYSNSASYYYIAASSRNQTGSKFPISSGFRMLDDFLVVD